MCIAFMHVIYLKHLYAEFLFQILSTHYILGNPGIDSKESIASAYEAGVQICKCLSSPGIDSARLYRLAESWESIPRILKRLRMRTLIYRTAKNQYQK